MRAAVVLALAGLWAAGFSPIDWLKHPAEVHTEKGIRALREGHYDEALQRFGEAERRLPQSPVPPLDRGVAAYRAGRYDQALEAFRAAAERAEGENSRLARDAHYNAGNALFKLGRYREAIAEYERALAIDREDGDAAFNKRLAEELLRRQRERPTPAPRPKQGRKQQKQQGGRRRPSPQPSAGSGKKQSQSEKQSARQRQEEHTPRRGIATPPPAQQRPNLPKLSEAEAERILRLLEERERRRRMGYGRNRGLQRLEELQREMEEQLRRLWGEENMPRFPFEDFDRLFEEEPPEPDMGDYKDW